MLNVVHELKLNTHCHTWSEALCPLELIHMECSYILNALHRLKLYAHCYT